MDYKWLPVVIEDLCTGCGLCAGVWARVPPKWQTESLSSNDPMTVRAKNIALLLA